MGQACQERARLGQDPGMSQVGQAGSRAHQAPHGSSSRAAGDPAAAGRGQALHAGMSRAGTHARTQPAPAHLHPGCVGHGCILDGGDAQVTDLRCSTERPAVGWCVVTQLRGRRCRVESAVVGWCHWWHTSDAAPPPLLLAGGAGRRGQHLGGALQVQQDVVRLQVPVDHSGVQVVQGSCHVSTCMLRQAPQFSHRHPCPISSGSITPPAICASKQPATGQ
jgi:hypothetical protein